MAQITFNKLSKIKNCGLVFYGLTDELEDFGKIINSELNQYTIGTGSFEDKFQDIYEIFTKNNRRDIVLVFKDKPSVDFGKLAIWRVKLNGLASWISDYVVNCKSDFI